MDQLPDAVKEYMPLIEGIVVAILILVVGWIVSKWANRLVVKIFRARNLDPALGGFLGSMAQYTVLVAVVIAALGAVGVETTSLVAVFASAGLAVGLALQGSLSSFAAGVMILFFRPFTLGDRVTVADQFGDVTDIGLFATTLVTLQNETIILPNSAIVAGSIINYSSKGTLRYSVDVGIAYGEDVPKAMDVMLKAAKGAELVLADPAPVAVCVGLGASSVDFQVHCWSTAADYIPMQDSARRAIYDALNEAGVEIPFNQLVLHQAEAAAAAAVAA